MCATFDAVILDPQFFFKRDIRINANDLLATNFEPWHTGSAYDAGEAFIS
jgi:hypothetical protein